MCYTQGMHQTGNEIVVDKNDYYDNENSAFECVMLRWHLKQYRYRDQG